MCGTEETKYSHHTFDKKYISSQRTPQRWCLWCWTLAYVRVGACKTQEVMTRLVSTDNPISHRYPPVVGTRELVNKYTPVGVIIDLVGEIDTPVDDHALHRGKGNISKTCPNPPIEKVGLVHKDTPVGVKRELAREKDGSLDSFTLHQETPGNKPKAQPEKTVVK